jgi:hypothetical protein
MGKPDIKQLATESIHLQELDTEGFGAGHIPSENGDKKDTEKKEEASPASLGNFFVCSYLTQQNCRNYLANFHSVCSNSAPLSTGH